MHPRMLLGLLPSLLTTTPVGPAWAAPDLSPQVSDVSVFVSDVDPGDVAEGCAGGTTARTLVRFTLRADNLGPDDLVVGAPDCPDCHENPGVTCGNPLFTCSTAHGHAHFTSFVRPELLDEHGTVVAQGYKFGFCLLDSICATPQYTDCLVSQGITAGCSDVYLAGLPCQYVDVTDANLAPGVYSLRVTLDPQGALAEADEDNNTAEAPVRIGAPPPACPVHVAGDVPRAIPDDGSVSSTLVVGTVGPLKSLEVVGLRGTHSSVGDLEIHLKSPAGTDVVLMNRVCGGDDGFVLDLDDAACDPIGCPPAGGMAWLPSQPLAAFDAENAAGTWTLTVFDRAAGGTGTLDGWGLEICVPGTGCPIYTSTDVPKSLPELGEALSTVGASPGTISDVHVIALRGTHTFMSDLEFHLISPAGTDINVMNRVCGVDDDFTLDLDDSACRDITCPPTDGLVHRSSSPLSAFLGEDAGGTWTLKIIDLAEGDGGQLDGWGLQICSCGNGVLDPSEQCDDGNTTSGDCCSASCETEVTCPMCQACDPLSLSCVAAPRLGCRRPVEPRKATLSVSDGRRPSSDRLQWRWRAGAATIPSDFGDPRSDEGYALCIYDRSKVTPSLLYAGGAAEGTCGPDRCWRALGRSPGKRGFSFSNRAGTPDGLTKVGLKPGVAGRAQATVMGRGQHLGLPAMPLPLPLQVQLHGGNACWEAEFSQDGVSRNDPTRFRARAE